AARVRAAFDDHLHVSWQAIHGPRNDLDTFGGVATAAGSPRLRRSRPTAARRWPASLAVAWPVVSPPVPVRSPRDREPRTRVSSRRSCRTPTMPAQLQPAA